MDRLHFKGVLMTTQDASLVALHPRTQRIDETRPPKNWRTSRAAKPTPAQRLEPISKSPEEDDEAGELDKTEEVLGVELPADEDATLPLYPGEEALDEPASHIAA